MRLVIDTDPGVDDALAILLAVADASARVEALTVVAGNVGLERTVANACTVLDALDVDPARTRVFRDLLEDLPAENGRRTLIVIGTEGDWTAVYRAAGNLPNVKIIRAGYINVHDVLTHDRLLVTTEALTTINELWGAN